MANDMCDNKLLLNLKIYLTQGLTFMHRYKWISNSYVAEFFTQNLWMKFPSSWRACFEELTLTDIVENILHSDKHGGHHKSVWPLSLLSFIATCHALSLNRQQHYMFQHRPDDVMIPKQLSYTFWKHMKPKKRHELSLLPTFIHMLCEKTDVKNIVDVGSGLGHLARVLAYRYGYNVTAVERCIKSSPVAQKFDREIEESLKRFEHVDGVDCCHGEVRHISKEIRPDISSEEFVSLFDVQSSDGNQSNDASMTKYILIGLHTCGDLASTMLRVFHNTPEIVGIVSVSCCYFRMTIQPGLGDHVDEINESLNDTPVNDECCCDKFSIPELHKNYTRIVSDIRTDYTNEKHHHNRHCNTDEKNFPNRKHPESPVQQHKSSIQQDTGYGFPLSAFLQRMKYQPLKYKSLETACHFLDDYVQKLLKNSPNLKLHCYRAIMELFIRHVDPKLVLVSVRCKKIKHAAEMTFEEYASKVFERLDLAFEKDRLNEIEYRSLLEQEKNVTLFHSLALLMGPVIESMVLVDKQVFLMESKFPSSLVPVFDAEISPRNFVIVSHKTNCKIFD